MICVCDGSVVGFVTEIGIAAVDVHDRGTGLLGGGDDGQSEILIGSCFKGHGVAKSSTLEANRRLYAAGCRNYAEASIFLSWQVEVHRQIMVAKVPEAEAAESITTDDGAVGHTGRSSMTAHTRIEDTTLAALISSKICHDLAGQIGAINNGLELLEEENDEDTRYYALELIQLIAPRRPGRS